ncbi:pseudouridine-5'-phosphate glycosidase [Bacillus timonensis]|nr:pseudouridine-5'-phosphate glycosidase [Bacillus timonensis]
MNRFLKVSDEVQAALANNTPVVALESTIISHGMPYPTNVVMALEVERIIRENGAVPATIAILDGQICVGLSETEITRLATEESVVKTSIRDLPGVLAKRVTGATTVATTTYAAYMAGIKFFATGGLGGVHRGLEETFDISADLPALAAYPVCVISAGVKSILDIPKTLEYFETSGVPVYGFRTNQYPGFYVSDSGCEVTKIEMDELVKLLKVKEELDLKQAVHVAVPIPKESQLDPSLIQVIIEEALSAAKEKGIYGKDVTPFLLSMIKEKTGGESLKANIALMKNNARTAALIAKAYCTQ